jgi:mRNA interferase MazF
MKNAFAGEIWRVDFGMAAKVRPALIVSDFPRDEELALLVVVPHTTSVRGTRWEISFSKAFLKPGVFHLQQIQPISLSRFDFKLGELSPLEFRSVKEALIRQLNLNSNNPAI